MRVAEIVTLIPEAQGALAEYGLHCFNCAGAEFETLDDGCRSHGFGTEEIDELVDDLNRMIADLPAKPMTLALTKQAALAIKDIAAKEGKSGPDDRVGLAVIVDGSGGFCMEFRAKAARGEQTFVNAEVPDVRIFASTLTLKRIGGSTIDFRDGRFKLDLAGEAGEPVCCGSDDCSCSK